MVGNRGSSSFQCICGRCPFRPYQGRRDEADSIVPAKPHRFCLLIFRLSQLSGDRPPREWPPREVRNFMQLCYGIGDTRTALPERQFAIHSVAIMNGILNEHRQGRGEGPLCGLNPSEVPSLNPPPPPLTNGGIHNGYSIADLYRMPIDRTLQVTLTFGASGETVSIEAPAQVFAYTLVEWFMRHRSLFTAKFAPQAGVWRTARCVYSVSRRGDTLIAGCRLHLPSMLVDVLTHALRAPPTDTEIQWRTEVGILWQLTKVCEICGTSSEEFDEFTPFVNCRYCGARPCLHHGRCCPIRNGRREMTQPRPPRQRYMDMRNETNVHRILQATMSTSHHHAVVQRHMQVSASGICDPT